MAFHSQTLMKCLEHATTKGEQNRHFSGPREAHRQSPIPFKYHESSDLTVYKSIALTLQTHYSTLSEYIWALNFSILCVNEGDCIWGTLKVPGRHSTGLGHEHLCVLVWKLLPISESRTLPKSNKIVPNLQRFMFSCFLME